eukprot:TRINITY_DN3239_c0_g1_i1.p1 TRINITY_DN3239_c0_g1~~TRINITY_DN3239_c0_g1_i1.p1  ORF type:complete len:355 (-),score=118.82 TRINITY_DN3239_c0_g1_i1:178-1242(-)
MEKPDTSNFQCRMYENKFPEVDELVVVNVRSIAEMGAYVSLLEYNNVEGMILLSELSRKRIRSIGKLIRVGRQEVVVVLRVDKEKGYIDLSKRRVSSEEVAKAEEKFSKSKAVHSIMRHCAEVLHVPLEELYTKFGWPLYKKYGHAYDAFKLANTEPDKLFEGLDIPTEFREPIIKNIKRRMTSQPVKLRSDVEVTCFGYEGIDAIKEALLAGQAVGTEEIPVKIRLYAPPLYVMTTVAHDKDKGKEALEAAIKVIQEKITEKNGNIVVKMAPKTVSEKDDKNLTAQMLELEKRNQEISGDDDDEDEAGDIEIGAKKKAANEEEEGEEGEEDEEGEEGEEGEDEEGEGEEGEDE